MTTQTTIGDNDGVISTDVGAASSGPFAIDYPFYSLDDVVVTVTDSEGVTTTLVRGVDYDITATPNDDGIYPSGTVDLVTAISNSTIVRTRETGLERISQFPLLGYFDRNSLNADLNRIVSAMQDFRRMAQKAIRFPPGEEGLNSELEGAARRAGLLLAFNASDGSVDLSTMTLAEIEMAAANTLALTATVPTYVGTVAALKALTTTPPIVHVLGHTNTWDRGGGVFGWKSGDATADDGGSVIQLNSGGTGRYIRVDQAFLTPQMYGAQGSGDDTLAFYNFGLAVAGRAGHIPAGTYAISGKISGVWKNFTVYSNTTILVDEGATLTNADTSDATSSNAILKLDGDNITYDGGQILGELSGPVYGTYGDVPTPYYLAQLYQNTGGERPKNIKFRNVRGRGGRFGFFFYGLENCEITHWSVEDTYDLAAGFVATSGANGPMSNRCIVSDFHVKNAGLGEGLKLSSLYQSSGCKTTITTTRGSTTATVATTSGIVVNQIVVASGVARGTYVTAIDTNLLTVTLSEAARSTLAGTAVTFAWQPYTDVKISNGTIDNCGRFDPDYSLHQEGLDLFMGACNGLQIHNVTIRDCGNGGIELKGIDTALIYRNRMEGIQISDCYLESRYDSTVGIALNYSYLTPTVTSTKGSATATVSSASALVPTMQVRTANFPEGTKISSISGTTVVFDQVATGSATNAAAIFTSGVVDKVGKISISNCMFRYVGDEADIATTMQTYSSTTITVASANGLYYGLLATGSGIPSGAYITNVSGTTVTLSAATTSTLGAGQPVTFTSREPVTPTGCYAIGGSSCYTDVTVKNCESYGPFTQFINLSPRYAGADQTTRRLVVKDTKVRDAQYGVYFSTGYIDDCRIENCDMVTTQSCVAVASSMYGGSGLVVDGGTYTATDSGRYPFACDSYITGIRITGGAQLKGTLSQAVNFSVGVGIVDHCILTASAAGTNAIRTASLASTTVSTTSGAATATITSASGIGARTTVDTTEGNPVVVVGSTTGLRLGMVMSSANIPAGAIILSVDSATQLTLSAAPSLTAAGTTIDFWWPNAIINSANVPAGTTLVSLANLTITMSANASATAAGTAITFGGSWEAFDNDLRLTSTGRLQSQGTPAGTFVGYNNNRGYFSAAPTVSATVGEVAKNSAPASGGYAGWIYETGGTWKGTGLIA